jgi:hypothetical protein
VCSYRTTRNTNIPQVHDKGYAYSRREMTIVWVSVMYTNSDIFNAAHCVQSIWTAGEAEQVETGYHREKVGLCCADDRVGQWP